MVKTRSMEPLEQTWRDGTRHYDVEYDPEVDFAKGSKRDHVEKLARER